MPRRIRRGAIAAAAVLATAAALVPATRADAIPVCRIGYQCSYTFYDNADHDTVVGSRMEWCDGTTDVDGRMSSYLVFTTARCNDQW